jgi:hypothetical protein
MVPAVMYLLEIQNDRISRKRGLPDVPCERYTKPEPLYCAPCSERTMSYPVPVKHGHSSDYE